MAVTLTTEEVVALAEEAKGYQERISELESENRKLKRKLCLAREESAYWHARLFEGLRSPRIADKWFTRSSRYHKMADEYKENR